MPITDVRYAVGSLDAAGKALLAERLTEVLIQMEGGANTEGGRAFARVRFAEFAADDLWIAGRCNVALGAGPTFLVHIAIPEGCMKPRAQERGACLGGLGDHERYWRGGIRASSAHRH